MMDTLQITDLKVHFRRGGSAPIRAVDGLTLSIGPRETVGLVGESGYPPADCRLAGANGPLI